jgi:hypothetical protein
VPPDVLTGVPLDCVGADDGDCKFPELLELELLLDEPELELELFDELELEGELAGFAVLLALVEWLLADPELVAALLAPGSMTATTPAVATLATPMVAVAAFRR